MRECGGCTVCCYVAEIPELRKPINSLCSHCEAQVGCRIYKDRPGSCRDFRCAWLEGRVADERLRPDRCGVMFESLPGTDILVAFTGPSNGAAWKQGPVQDEIKGLLLAGHPIIVREGNGSKWHVLVPEGRTSEGIVAQFRHVVEERKAWRPQDTRQTCPR